MRLTYDFSPPFSLFCVGRRTSTHLSANDFNFPTQTDVAIVDTQAEKWTDVWIRETMWQQVEGTDAGRAFADAAMVNNNATTRCLIVCFFGALLTSA